MTYDPLKLKYALFSDHTFFFIQHMTLHKNISLIKVSFFPLHFYPFVHKNNFLLFEYCDFVFYVLISFSYQNSYSTFIAIKLHSQALEFNRKGPLFDVRVKTIQQSNSLGVYFNIQNYNKVTNDNCFRNGEAWFLIRPYNSAACFMQSTMAWHRQWCHH